jgi:peptidoglycan hydrolase-like protein with peptidoglycan-binding domain
MTTSITQTYRRGDTGPYVVKIQRALNEILKINLKTDGDFGPSTEQRLIEWQGKFNLPKTGVFSDNTAATLGAYIDRRFLDEQDFIDSASKLGVEIATVKAVQEVESKGFGFLDDGRSIILFERHIFRKELNKAMSADPELVKRILNVLGLKPQAARDPIITIQDYLSNNQSDIYNSVAGGYVGGFSEYNRLAKAALLDRDCARRSASWGLYQIMGYHHSGMGFATVNDMVASFDLSERNQQLGFNLFILGKTDPRFLPALKSKDWLAFAKAYNGPAQKGYDVKLAAAYEKHKISNQ